MQLPEQGVRVLERSGSGFKYVPCINARASVNTPVSMTGDGARGEDPDAIPIKSHTRDLPPRAPDSLLPTPCFQPLAPEPLISYSITAPLIPTPLTPLLDLRVPSLNNDPHRSKLCSSLNGSSHVSP